jgi:hypothetical protein
MNTAELIWFPEIMAVNVLIKNSSTMMKILQIVQRN